MPLDRREDRRHLVAERDGNRLLEIAPARRPAYRGSVAREPASARAISASSSSTIRSLSRICNTVAVSVMSCVVAPQWQYSPSRSLQSAFICETTPRTGYPMRSVCAAAFPCRSCAVTVAHDLVGRLRRNDTEPALNDGQAPARCPGTWRFGFRQTRCRASRAAEHVAEDARVDDRCSHCFLLECRECVEGHRVARGAAVSSSGTPAGGRPGARSSVADSTG